MHNRHFGLLGWYCLAATLLIWLPAGCGNEQLDQRLWIARGQETLKPFKAELKSALMDGLESGPEDAIEVCQLLAPEIAGRLSSETVQVGRTSHRLRNMKNAPRAWVKPLLEGYVSDPGRPEPQVVPLPGGGVGYVEPIYVVPMCLSCHGRSLSPGIAARLDELYPGDQARDFSDHDFRGLFWVEFTAAE